MERKLEEQARQLKVLQGQVERLRRENDQLPAQIEKSRDLGKDMRESGRAAQLIACYYGKEPIAPDDVDTPMDDELSLGSSPSLSLSPAKNARESTKTTSRKRLSPHLAFNDVVSGASRRARREAGRRQNRPDQALGNPPVLPSSTLPPMPPTHPTFSVAPMFYISPIALI